MHRCKFVYVYILIHLHACVKTYIHIHIYKYDEREGRNTEREREGVCMPAAAHKLRINQRSGNKFPHKAIKRRYRPEGDCSAARPTWALGTTKKPLFNMGMSLRADSAALPSPTTYMSLNLPVGPGLAKTIKFGIGNLP